MLPPTHKNPKAEDRLKLATTVLQFATAALVFVVAVIGLIKLF